MARSPEWILENYRSRRDAHGPARIRAQEIGQTYDGDIMVPIPELDESRNAAVANLLTQGLDQLAMRIASVPPQVMCPPVIAGQPKSEDNARIRRLALGWWWQENRYQRKMRKRARWLIGYASTPVVIRPDKAKGIPVWELRDPLCAYPAPMPEADDLLPDDCMFGLRRSWGWINERWPQAARQLNWSSDPDPTETYEVIEYLDGEETVMVAVGKPAEAAQRPYGQPPAPKGAPFVELARFPNLLGRCPVVYPTRLSLNHPQGQFDQLPALYRLQSKLMALYLVSAERAIFPDTWFISRPNELVNVIKVPDGRAGIPGEVKGGDLKEVTVGPPPQIQQLVDYLERNQRVTASISPDTGGEAPTNVRTGRAGENLMHNTVDFWMQEAQETLALSAQEENRLALATARTYFGHAEARSQYVHWKWAKGPVAYIPDIHFDSDVNTVSWPYAGSDANQLAVRGGQMVGLKAMSIRTFQEISPDIDDPDAEHDRITGESMEAALLSAVDQAVASGQVGPAEVARMTELVLTHKKSLFEAYQQVEQEAKDAQAAQQAPGQPGAPGMPGQPPGPGGQLGPGTQQMLGLGPNNPPGGGPPTVSPGVQHMSQLMASLRGPTPAAPR